MSTVTSWCRPQRRCQKSAAASADAAMLTWAAVPTANEDGSAGSAPVSRICDSAPVGRPADCQSCANATRASTGPDSELSGKRCEGCTGAYPVVGWHEFDCASRPG